MTRIVPYDPSTCGETDEAFLDRMNVKLKHALKFKFTLAEVAKCYQLVMGDTDATYDPDWIEYCQKHMNKERNDMCFYK